MYITIIAIVIVALSLLMTCICTYIKYKITSYIFLAIFFFSIMYLLYKLFFTSKDSKEDFKENYKEKFSFTDEPLEKTSSQDLNANINFSFRDDADNVEEKPEMYCGDSHVLPEKYDVMGTRFKCMRKGVGVGMVLGEDERLAFLNKIRQPPTEKLYCGDNPTLPTGYTRFGKKTECMRKGVGVGLGMPQEKRLALQHKPARKLGKRELMTLAERLKINTNNLSRQQASAKISEKLWSLNVA